VCYFIGAKNHGFTQAKSIYSPHNTIEKPLLQNYGKKGYGFYNFQAKIPTKFSRKQEKLLCMEII